jgi:hypothetical protein
MLAATACTTATLPRLTARKTSIRRSPVLAWRATWPSPTQTRVAW